MCGCGRVIHVEVEAISVTCPQKISEMMGEVDVKECVGCDGDRKIKARSHRSGL